MKTILVPTDFSEASENAIEYAVQFSHHVDSHIVLFHVYHTPPVAVEVPVVVISLEEQEKVCMEKLNEIRKSILSTSKKDLDIECACECGFAVDRIMEFTKENKVDLIIMGMQGGGWLSEKLIGSITTAVIRDGKCPVISIGSGVKFNVPKKIAVALDGHAVRKATFWPLKDLVKAFGSHVYILNVVNEVKTIPVSSDAEVIEGEDVFADLPHSVHQTVQEDVSEGISDFIAEYGIDMLVMVTRKKSLIQNLFVEPHIKKMAFHTSIPLLAIHE
ncbi:MAG: universal stress protein [Bacteroidota bacterium]|nr:universal stress protein [Bacteroidota bacterium]